MHYYVFNGDADGLCALQQLRLAEPGDAKLVTGVKRDIALLQQVIAQPEDQVTVLDIAVDQNQEALLRLLALNVTVRYFDHHTATALPIHPHFKSYIETIPDKGTSLLVDEYLSGQCRGWAIVGTFGDNFDARASRIAVSMGYVSAQIMALRTLGILLNYNGYGLTLQDLHIAPDILARRLGLYSDPLEFIATDTTFKHLHDGYHQDMALAAALRPDFTTERHSLYLLPDMPWTRRVSGVFANQLAQEAPGRAHALLTRLPTGDSFLVSVRAPLTNPQGADVLCRQFATGGGRKAAGGINVLPDAHYATFVQAFSSAF